ncbi:hypothetical protein CC2G_004734 [Coprinopsis cinerea AmutBmut pab1-1]|nr:hypothetical protein CC2G_004734 [Coprinopsis cinerea AmutBmut pab1-1]
MGPAAKVVKVQERNPFLLIERRVVDVMNDFNRFIAKRSLARITWMHSRAGQGHYLFPTELSLATSTMEGFVPQSRLNLGNVNLFGSPTAMSTFPGNGLYNIANGRPDLEVMTHVRSGTPSFLFGSAFDPYVAYMPLKLAGSWNVAYCRLQTTRPATDLKGRYLPVPH